MHKESWRRQQGFAHLGMLIAIVAVVALIGLIIWRVWDAQQNSSPNNAAVQQAVANANCTGIDKDLCKFFAGWKETASYRIISTNVADGKTTTATYELAAGGKRSHVVTTIEGKPYESIAIDNTTYIKDQSGNTWWKQTIEPSKAQEPTAPKTDFTEPSSDNKQSDKPQPTYKLIGKEACGNLTCFKYQMVDPSAADQTNYIWFDIKDYQLRRMRTEFNGGNSDDQTFSYNNVNINAPASTKDLGPNQVIDPNTGQPFALPSASDIPTQ